MSTAYVVVAFVLSFMLAYAITLDFTRNKNIIATMAKLHVPESWLPTLGILKAAGAIGLLVGIPIPRIGVAGAVGLVLFFAGAVMTHLRARDYAIAPAIVFLLSAVGALVLRLVSS